MCACIDAYNIYMEQMPDYLNSNGRFFADSFSSYSKFFATGFPKIEIIQCVSGC